MKKLILLSTLIFSLLSCKKEIEPYSIEKPIDDSIRIESIFYKIRNGYGDLYNDYTVSYVYESGKIKEIKNYLNRYNKIYEYESGLVINRKYYEIDEEKIVAIDSFLYDQNNLLKQVFGYSLDENKTQTLWRVRKFSHDSYGKIIKTEDYRMPENEKSFIREYSWEDQNVNKYKYYHSDETSIVNIEEFYEYDQSFNYQCLEIVDIDQPISVNNLSNMTLNDYLGQYEGIYSIENQFEYNDNDLPIKIVRHSLGIFDTYADTILITYQ